MKPEHGQLKLEPKHLRLLEKSTQLSDVALLNLLNMGTGILEGLYEKWLGIKDSSFNELDNYVEHELDELEGYGLYEAI